MDGGRRKKPIKEKEGLKIIDGDEIISVNDRARLKGIQKQYPNLEIIIGEVSETDQPVSVDLAEMEASKIEILDAATDSILGKRVDRLEKPLQFPVPVKFMIAFVAGAASCFFAMTI